MNHSPIIMPNQEATDLAIRVAGVCHGHPADRVATVAMAILASVADPKVTPDEFGARVASAVAAQVQAHRAHGTPEGLRHGK